MNVKISKIPKLDNRLKLATILQITSIFGLFTMLIASYYYYKHKSYNDTAYNYYKQIYKSNQYTDIIRKLYKYADKCNIEKKKIHTDFPKDIDIVLSGGGFKCSYGLGVLLGLILNKHINIARYSGTSAGAHLLYYIISNQIDKIFNFCYSAVKTIEVYPYIRPYYIWNDFFRENSTNTFIPTPGKFFISISKIICFFPLLIINNKISKYDSIQHVRNLLMATSGISFITYNTLWETIDKYKCIDGGITDNTPYFRDNIRDQLVIDLQYIPKNLYGDTFLESIIYWNISNIIKAIKLGINDVYDLLINGPNNINHKRIQIIKKDDQKKIPDTNKININKLCKCCYNHYFNL